MAEVDKVAASKVDKTVTPASQPERFSKEDVIAAINKSKAKPLMVADGRAVDLATQLRKYGNKQISLVVLS